MLALNGVFAGTDLSKVQRSVHASSSYATRYLLLEQLLQSRSESTVLQQRVDHCALQARLLHPTSWSVLQCALDRPAPLEIIQLECAMHLLASLWRLLSCLLAHFGLLRCSLLLRICLVALAFLARVAIARGTIRSYHATRRCGIDDTSTATRRSSGVSSLRSLLAAEQTLLILLGLADARHVVAVTRAREVLVAVHARKGCAVAPEGENRNKSVCCDQIQIQDHSIMVLLPSPSVITYTRFYCAVLTVAGACRVWAF